MAKSVCAPNAFKYRSSLRILQTASDQVLHQLFDYQHVYAFVWTECNACQQEISEGQALIALDQQWHIWCFKCQACKAVLHGEYMSKDGKVYCEKDYQVIDLH